MNELIGMDITQLSYGALFVWLLFDSNKKNKEREEKYQATIETLSTALNNNTAITEDVKEIKGMLMGGAKNE